jgi:hypothetical protein
VSRSQQAARFGRLAEEAACRRYGLDPEHTSWYDARDSDGRPWDVKAAMLSRDQPRFRLWADQHADLLEEAGGYIFVGYIPRGSGIEVVATRALEAADLQLRFGGAGAHPKGDQVKVNPRRILRHR